MRSTVFLNELTRDEVQAVAPQAIAVVPTAATEQHGPHLPIMTDSCIVAAVAERAAQAASVPVLVAPVVSYGISAHHFPFPGVMSLSTESFIGVLNDLGDSLARSGFRRVFILNGHGGNDEAIRLAARWIGRERKLICAAASYWTLAWSALADEGRVFDTGLLPGHAGGFETALMQALRPDLLEGTTMPPPASTAIPRPEPAARPLIVRPDAWEGMTGGYSDDPARATREAGERFLAIIAREVARSLDEVHALVQ